MEELGADGGVAGGGLEFDGGGGGAGGGGAPESAVADGGGEEFVEFPPEGGDVDAVLGAFGAGDGGDDGGEVEVEGVGVVEVAFSGDA